MTRFFFWMILVAFMACSSRRAAVKDNKKSAPGQEKTSPEDPGKNKPDPKQKLTPEEEEKKKKYPHLPRFENDFKVALILPFFLKKDYSNPASGDFHYMAMVTDYYEGWILGLDSMKKAGIRVKVYVYDNQNESLQTVKILQKSDFSGMDLIFGPLDKTSFELVMQYGKKHEIGVVSPFSTATLRNSINPYAFYCNPDLPAYAYRMANHIISSRAPANIVYVSDGKNTDLSFFKPFQDSLAGTSYKIRKITSSASMDIASLLESKDSTPNYIVVASDEELTASYTIKALKKVTDAKVILIGLDTWRGFKNQEFTFWNRFNLHLIANYHLDDSSADMRNFWFLYKNKFKDEPSEYAVQGFDHSIFFCQALLTFGKYFPGYVLNTEFEQLHNNLFWHFNGNGVANRAVNLLEFKNYRLHKIKRN